MMRASAADSSFVTTINHLIASTSTSIDNTSFIAVEQLFDHYHYHEPTSFARYRTDTIGPSHIIVSHRQQKSTASKENNNHDEERNLHLRRNPRIESIPPTRWNSLVHHHTHCINSSYYFHKLTWTAATPWILNKE